MTAVHIQDSPASSSASAVLVNLRFEANKIHYGPPAHVHGGAPPAYDQTVILPFLDHTLQLDPDGPSVKPTLHIIATSIETNASSTGFGIDFISAQGQENIDSATFLLTSNPTHPGLMSVLGLEISADFIHSQSSASHVFGASHDFLTGSASFGSLHIGGALIGEGLTFSGNAAADTVLISNSMVTVTLNKQTFHDLASPVPGQTRLPATGLTTDAIDVHFNNASLFGGALTGDIIIGRSSADLNLLVSRGG